MTSPAGIDEESEMSFGDHLEELRSRMIRAVVSTLGGFLIIFAWHEEVLRFVVAPYADIAHGLGMNSVLNVLGPTDAFFAYMKVSLIVSLLASAPIWMWQFWAFIGAGLYSHEKKAVYKFAPPMIFLFAAGVSFGYFILIPIGLRYLLSFADPSVLQNWIGLSEYLSLFTTLTLVLGITFQLPVIMALLTKVGLMTPQSFRDKRRYFILGAFFFGALLTPPDAVTQILLALPLVFLFELGISCSWLVQGEGREPIDWARWKKRGLAVVVILITLVVFGDKIISSYRERLVSQNIRVFDDGRTEGLPYFELLEGCKDFLGYKPDRLYVIRAEDDMETVVVGDGERSNILLFQYQDDRVTQMSLTKNDARFLVNTNARSVHIQELGEKPGKDFLGPFMLALENAPTSALVNLESLLFGLVKERPAGARPLVADDDDSAKDEVRDVWLTWWETEGRRWVYRP